jgi:hypothetical protein
MVITPKPKNRVAPKTPLTIKIIEDAQSGINTKGKPTEKAYKIFDNRGLFLLVTPAGRKLWRFKYRYGGKEKQLSLGIYPLVSLTEAREKRDTFRALVVEGIDPSTQVKLERETRQTEEARQLATTRFTLDNDGSLSLRLGNRCLTLTPFETVELRSFLDATRTVIPKENPCP